MLKKQNKKNPLFAISEEFIDFTRAENTNRDIVISISPQVQSQQFSVFVLYLYPPQHACGIAEAEKEQLAQDHSINSTAGRGFEPGSS